MKKHIQNVVIIAIRCKNRYLLTFRDGKHEGPQFRFKWNIPGGALEFGETLEEATRRETREELGIELGTLFLHHIPFIEIRDDWHGVFHIFASELEDISIKIRTNEEASKYGWFTLDEIKTLKRLNKTYEIALAAEETLEKNSSKKK